jgi:hypothetical protein
MSMTAPSVDDFKTRFVRDFSFAPESDPTNLSYIIDADVTRSINQGLIEFNESLFGTEAQQLEVFYFLAAFHLVENIKIAQKGLSAQAKMPVTNASVGGVSESYQIPERYAKDPFISQFLANAYGVRYLQFLLPQLIGNMAIVEGTTTY